MGFRAFEHGKAQQFVGKKEGSPLILNDDQGMNDDQARMKTKCLMVKCYIVK